MNGPVSRNVVLPVILAILVVLAWAGTTGSPFREHSLDAAAQRYVDAGFRRALVTFAAARTINAALSLVEGTSFSFEPLGVGVELSVGQVLHPLNQVVGQFADWMLAASVAFGAMEVLTKIGSAWALTAALTLGVAGWAVCWWRKSGPPAWLSRVLFILLILRFAVPVVSLGSEWAYSAFLADDYKKSQAVISAPAQEIDDQLPAISAPNIASEARSSLEGVKNLITRKQSRDQGVDTKPEAGRVEKIRSGITALVNAARGLPEHVIKLMVVFLLQTLAIPLLLVWILLKGSGVLLAGTRR